jgi:hypothetical protein
MVTRVKWALRARAASSPPRLPPITTACARPAGAVDEAGEAGEETEEAETGVRFMAAFLSVVSGSTVALWRVACCHDTPARCLLSSQFPAQFLPNFCRPAAMQGGATLRPTRSPPVHSGFQLPPDCITVPT